MGRSRLALHDLGAIAKDTDLNLEIGVLVKAALRIEDLVVPTDGVSWLENADRLTPIRFRVLVRVGASRDIVHGFRSRDTLFLTECPIAPGVRALNPGPQRIG